MNTAKVAAFLRKLVTNRSVPLELHYEALDLLLNEQSGRVIYGSKNDYGIALSDELTAAEWNVVNDLLGKNDKIGAIKEIRRFTGWGLKDSKDASENKSNFTNARPHVSLPLPNNW
jgi:hypothetical protein